MRSWWKLLLVAPFGAIVTSCAMAIAVAGCETKVDRDPPQTAEPPPAPIRDPRDPGESMEPPEPAVEPAPLPPASMEQPSPEPLERPLPPPPPEAANIVRVVATGDTWSVTVDSPDTGCDNYANWWEVVRPDGTLVYRRILAHSHVDENPFARTGGPVTLGRNDDVIIRAHMHPGGYGGRVFRGSIGSGFRPDVTVDATFAPALATAAPLPDGCAF